MLKDGVVHHHLLLDGVSCPTVAAQDLDYLLCSLDGDPQKLFKVKPESMRCSAKAPTPSSIGGSAQSTINFLLELTQLPLVSNDCTTGHKLQGQTKTNLVISVWSGRKNWNYVALSRVKTRSGLFLVAPLPCNTDFSIQPDLQTMIRELSARRPDAHDFDLDLLQSEANSRRRHLN